MDKVVYQRLATARQEEDVTSEYYIPEQFMGKIDPNYFCRGWNSKREKYCRARAGQGTDHSGFGRCRNHGGSSRITTGRYSQVPRAAISEHQDNFELEDEAQKLDIMPEAILLRALAANYLEGYEDYLQGVIRFNQLEEEEARADKRKPMFLNPPSLPEAAKLIKDAAELVDRIHKQRAANAIPMKDFFRIMGLMAEVTNRHVKTLEKRLRLNMDGVAALDDILAKIAEDWQSIKVAKM